MITLRSRDTSSAVQGEADQYNQMIVSAQGAKFQEAVLDGRMFSVANATKVATTAGVTTTWTGLAISNPTGSGKNVIVHEFGYALMIAAVVAAGNDALVGLQTASIATPVSALTKQNCLDGCSADSSVVYADDGATLVGPVLKKMLSSLGEEDTATGLFPAPPSVYRPNGALILPPGRTVATYTTLATTACLVFHFVWEEIDE